MLKITPIARLDSPPAIVLGFFWRGKMLLCGSLVRGFLSVQAALPAAAKDRGRDYKDDDDWVVLEESVNNGGDNTRDACRD